MASLVVLITIIAVFFQGNEAYAIRTEQNQGQKQNLEDDYQDAEPTQNLSRDGSLLLPAINEPLPGSVFGLSMPQDASIVHLVLNLDNSTAKRIGKLIRGFTTFQQSFDRTVHLTNPFLTLNEIDPLKQKSARNDFVRQTKEIKWVSAVASHRMKLVKLYEELSFMCNYLKTNSEISIQEIATVREKEKDLIHSEAKLKQKTQDLVLYVLQN
ncbi:GSCOCT00014284001.2-RA-CDS [Cotesia congregata]|uniref:Uncharacterized protein n=2 Tax=root TaxID=1 RepID=S6D2T0_COTCN|nr:hypothetical protein CcBV_30.2 [Bracoviriform congregatae]CAD6243334.1 GSCOCT00014284001.2-RA-CDS [Cotesia congregata]CAG17499.1 hypothetical protein CcBV_30.2 [Bracoviriform congregatae]CCQ71088.1 hypothetical protein BV14-1 [Cotesia congregata]